MDTVQSLHLNSSSDRFFVNKTTPTTIRVVANTKSVAAAL